MNSNFIPREKADFIINFSHNGEDVEITGKGAVELEQDYTPFGRREATVKLNNVDGFLLRASKQKLPVEYTARVKVDKITPKNVEKARAAAGVDKNTEFVIVTDNRTLRDTTIEFRWTA